MFPKLRPMTIDPELWVLFGHKKIFLLVLNAWSHFFFCLSVCLYLSAMILSWFCWGPKPLLPPCGHSDDVLLWVHRFVCAVRAHHNLDIISEIKYQAVYVCSAAFSFNETQFTLRPTRHTHTHVDTHMQLNQVTHTCVLKRWCRLRGEGISAWSFHSNVTWYTVELLVCVRACACTHIYTCYLYDAATKMWWFGFRSVLMLENVLKKKKLINKVNNKQINKNPTVDSSIHTNCVLRQAGRPCWHRSSWSPASSSPPPPVVIINQTGLQGLLRQQRALRLLTRPHLPPPPPHFTRRRLFLCGRSGQKPKMQIKAIKEAWFATERG